MARISAKVSIEGTKPFLFHTFPMDTFSSTKKKEGKSGDNNQEWKDTVLMDENRNLYFYNTYLLGSIPEGGKEIKMGRGNISKKIASCIEIMENRVFLDGLKVPEEDQLLKLDTEPVYLDVRAVVNPMTKGRNLRYRIAAKSGWRCTFFLTWDDRIVSREQIKQCIENAGMLTGIGDGRKIGFGRYKLTAFEIQK